VNLILTKDVLYQLSYMGMVKAGNETRTHNSHLGRVELYQLSYTRKPYNGQGWVRTTVGVSQWIYSPSPLAARAPTQSIHGADGGTQTPDQLITNQLLYQLSYIGKLFLNESFEYKWRESCKSNNNTKY
jgi:hypothetical protein